MSDNSFYQQMLHWHLTGGREGKGKTGSYKSFNIKRQKYGDGRVEGDGDKGCPWGLSTTHTTDCQMNTETILRLYSLRDQVLSENSGI